TLVLFVFFFSSRRRHTRSKRDWSSDVCSSDLVRLGCPYRPRAGRAESDACSSQEPFVVPLLQLGIDLLDRVQSHADQDQQGDARSEERRVGKEGRDRVTEGTQNRRRRRMTTS